MSVREYIDIIRLYLRDIINNHKTQGEWEIHLIMETNFISSEDSDETQIMQSKSDNIEIMMVNETDEIIEELFKSLSQK